MNTTPNKGRELMKRAYDARARLAEAKKMGAKRRDALWHKGHYDELNKLDNRRNSRSFYRKQHALPLDDAMLSAPKMKPWDIVKGRVPKSTDTDTP